MNVTDDDVRFCDGPGMHIYKTPKLCIESLIHRFQARTQTFEKKDAKLRYFTQWVRFVRKSQSKFGTCKHSLVKNSRGGGVTPYIVYGTDVPLE